MCTSISTKGAPIPQPYGFDFHRCMFVDLVNGVIKYNTCVQCLANFAYRDVLPLRCPNCGHKFNRVVVGGVVVS